MGIYIFLLSMYSRACGYYQDFLNRGLLLTRTVLKQGFISVNLKSSLRKFNDRHHDMVNRYGISVSQITTDIIITFICVTNHHGYVTFICVTNHHGYVTCICVTNHHGYVTFICVTNHHGYVTFICVINHHGYVTFIVSTLLFLSH